MKDEVVFADDDELDLTPQLIHNRYKIIKQVGQGSFGVVWLVHDTRRGEEQFALKMIRTNGEDGINAALREHTILQHLTHDNLLHSMSVFMHKDVGITYVCTLMEYFQRGTLEEELAKRATSKAYYSEENLIDLMLQLGRGVAHLHDNRLIHRDLKSANVLVSENGRLVICDFGQIKELDTTLTSTITGTLKYLAPEVLTEHKYDYGADIWSLGCIFLEMIQLELPQQLNMEAIKSSAYKKAINSIVVEQRGYSAELARITSKMLERETKSRSNVDTVLRDLTRLKEQMLDPTAEVYKLNAKTRPCEGEICGTDATLFCKGCHAYICDTCFFESHKFGFMKKHEKVDIRAVRGRQRGRGAVPPPAIYTQGVLQRNLSPRVQVQRRTIAEDIIHLIISFLPLEPRILNNLQQVNKAFYSCANNDMTWKRLVLTDYPMSKGVLTKDFKKAYIQLYIHKHEKMRETEKKGMTFFEALNQEEEDVKITLLGDACVGKSAIAIRLISDQYFSEYDPTIEDTYSKDLKIDNTTYVLNILDTSGMDDYESLRGNWISGSQAYIIVFDLTNRQTFDRVEVWVDRVYKYRGKNEARRTVPIVIVGTKSDLTDERVIAPQEAESLALTVGAKYVESSAKTRTNIDEIFFAALRRTSEEQEPDVFSLLTSLGKGVDIVASSRKNSKDKDCIVM